MKLITLLFSSGGLKPKKLSQLRKFSFFFELTLRRCTVNTLRESLRPALRYPSGPCTRTNWSSRKVGAAFEGCRFARHSDHMCTVLRWTRTGRICVCECVNGDCAARKSYTTLRIRLRRPSDRAPVSSVRPAPKRQRTPIYRPSDHSDPLLPNPPLAPSRP